MRVLTVLVFMGCGHPSDTPPPSPAPSTTMGTDQPASASVPAEPSEGADIGALPANAPKRIGARHLLVAYQGATGADPSLRRTRAEALDKAGQLRARIDAGEQLADLARQESDGPSAAAGGDLGAFGQGTMDARFENAAFRLQVGAISKLVETDFGFHLIERYALDEIRLAHVLVQYDEAFRSKQTRTRQAAEERIAEAAALLETTDAPLTVVEAFSDAPTAMYGTDLGWFARGQMLPIFDEAAFALSVGQTSPVLETRLGYHLLIRLE